MIITDKNHAFCIFRFTCQNANKKGCNMTAKTCKLYKESPV